MGYSPRINMGRMTFSRYGLSSSRASWSTSVSDTLCSSPVNEEKSITTAMSVVLRQQNSGGGAVRLSDDPELDVIGRVIDREQAVSGQ